MKQMKKGICLLLGLIMGISCMACAAKQEESPTKDTDSIQNDAVSVSSQSTVGDHDQDIVVALQYDMGTFDTNARWANEDFPIYFLIYDRLYEYDEDTAPVPHLAKEEIIISDHEIQYQIQQGAKFSDGTEIKAVDVAASIMYAVESGIGGEQYEPIETVDIIDDYTISVKTKSFFPQLKIALSDPLCSILPASFPYIRHCTYAPELPMAPLLEEKMRKYGITGAIGHTCAGVTDIERAVAYGARIATHMFDASGCDRSFEDAAKLTQHPQNCSANIMLAIPGLYYELICDSDGMHATKYSVCEVLRAGGEDHLILVSDTFVETAEQKEERDVNFDAAGCLSGSRLCLSMAVRNFIRFTGADIRVAFKCASTNSAKAMGLFDCVGSIDAGKMANLVLVDSDFHIKRVFFKGQEVQEVRD